MKIILSAATVLLHVSLPILSAATLDSLTLDECYRLAQANNPRSFLSASSVMNADLVLQELRAAKRPQVKFRGILEYAPTSKHFGYDPGLTNGGQLGSQVVVEQAIYDGGVRNIKSQQAEILLRQSKEEQKLAANDLKFEVAQTFTEVLRLQAEQEQKEASRIRLKDYLSLVARMQMGGQVGYTDVLKTRMQLSEAESAVKQGDADLRGEKFTLAELLGLDLAALTEFKVKGDLDSADAPTELDTTENLDRKITALKLQSITKDVAAARSEWKPTISVAGDLGLLTSIDNLKVPSQDRANMLGASVGLHVDMPIFTWGLTQTHLRQSLLALENAQWQGLAQIRALRAEHQKTSLQWVAARDHRDALHNNLATAKDNFVLTKSKYAGGTGLASEVLEAHRFWLDTQMSLIQAEADLRILSAKLKRLDAH